MENKKSKKTPILAIIIAAFVICFMISIITEKNDLSYFFNFICGGCLSYVFSTSSFKKLLFILIPITIVFIVVAQLIPNISLNYISYIVIIPGFIFGRLLSNTNNDKN